MVKQKNKEEKSEVIIYENNNEKNVGNEKSGGLKMS